MMTTVDDDQWISVSFAVELIRKRLGISVGKAEKILLDAYTSGEVRTRTPPIGGGIDLRYSNPLKRYPGLCVSFSDLKFWFNEHYPAKPKSKNKGGAPPKADWPAVEEAFAREVKEKDWPEPTNVKGWQTQADVVRWIKDQLWKGNDPVDVTDRTAREYAKKFLAKQPRK